MKFKFDKKYLAKGLTAFLVLAGGIILWYLVFHAEKFKSNMDILYNILVPILDGFVIAYIATPVLNFIEKKWITNLFVKVFKRDKIKCKKPIRAISLVLTMILFLALFYGMFVMVMSQLIPSIISIFDNFDVYGHLDYVIRYAPNKDKFYNYCNYIDIIDEILKKLINKGKGIEINTGVRTRIGYAIDIRNFFNFLHNEIDDYKNTPIKSFTLDTLDKLEASDIEKYVEYLKLYQDSSGNTITNHENSIKRKLCSIRAMYKYFHNHQKIEHNPVLQVNMPKLHEKAIVRLDANEVAVLLDNVENSNLATKKQQESAKKLATRDLALLTLLLGTGLRVSECVGLDINDVDFDNSRVKVVRKGGKEAYVYFGVEVEEELLKYLDERKHIIPYDESHSNALFLSSQRKRMCVRSVEKLVKKYASTVTTIKKITPHKLRSTYGTSLYQETKDIYLVANVLGHSDVNTTRKHYAELAEENKRNARNAVTLREKDS